MHKFILFAAIILTVGGCTSRPIVSIPPAACADMVPSGWAAGVEATPVPDNAPVSLGTALTAPVVAAIVAPWASAYVAMSGALEKANGRTADAMGIMRQCEKLVNAARPSSR